MKKIAWICLLTAAVAAGCRQKKVEATTFADDLMFLKKHMDVVLLSDARGDAQVAVCPSLQGRVMTSTNGNVDGPSFGWINRDHIHTHKVLPHFNPYGGEDRLWLGPEGGQFSIFFKRGDPFDLAHWQTPLAVDTDPFGVVSQARDKVVCSKKMHLKNYSDNEFHLEVSREVRLLSRDQVKQHLGLAPAERVKVVAYQSDNKITNTGKEAWTKETGLLSVWILGMYNASPTNTVVIPFVAGPESKLGPIVNDTYFGKVPANRLLIRKDVLYFKADAKYRGKIGVSPARCKSVLGSYDADKKLLTIVQFNKPKDARDYVNSMWAIQKDPFAGDAINSYSDGPQGPAATQMGQFYEMESSSPAAALKPDESLTHVHRIIHLQGPEKDLDPIAKAMLGVSLAEIKRAFR